MWLEIVDGSSGFTLYPPFSALPQAIPGRREASEHLISATVCGVVFFGFWLIALLQRRRQKDKGARLLFWLSLFLIFPLGIHIGGTVYMYYLEHRASEDLYQYYLDQSPQSLNENL
ncbi:hypothetical protein [Hymenobacter sp. YC55]|uniref:hypothetical protein n=1 Tax=Hymenobacter sp. YC55 TaxID=3034019 RepID=UPI0023F9049D|nr:hypothetical protein [Hymenobacter sp. YC55]MDF7811656.1 hypothetical protein [Hymenobacter sp. YC55]